MLLCGTIKQKAQKVRCKFAVRQYIFSPYDNDIYNRDEGRDIVFEFDDGIYRSSHLTHPRVRHAFSTREGGVSSLEHTRSMSLSFGLGDSDDTVRENMRLLCLKAGLSYDGLIGSPQYHSTVVRYVTSQNALEGIEIENTQPSDGFVTDEKGVSVLVRVADCTPILFTGEKEDMSPVVGAVHAGWRGTVSGIASVCVREMVSHGAKKESVRAAIGQCIRPCCFEVKDDFIDAVTDIKGAGFAGRHIKKRDGRFFADLVSMNIEILSDEGIPAENIDVSPSCTACRPELFHSHRASGGKRGTMGAVIGII